MRIPRVYTEQALSEGLTLELEPAPSQHIARAMRMQAADELTLFNGSGGEYAASIETLDKKSVAVLVGAHRSDDLESPLAIHLGIAISRGDRMDWVVQKATELGVQSISPLLSERTGVKLNADRATKKVQHWRQVSIAACEQCGRNRLPHLEPLQGLPGWLANTDSDTRFVLHHRTLGKATRIIRPDSVALLIGPEGGLSEVEIALAEKADFQSLKLGPRVMRTETAPLAAIAILQARWGDMAPGV